LFVEFTHSQRFETFARCHQHAFRFMKGVAREIVYDNLLSAVAERDGRLVRFQPRFWAFAREYGFCPRACTPRAAWQKGKCERAIGYLRKNFWPLRTFRDLQDVNHQVRRWLKEVANQRRHSETREIPEKRFQPEALIDLPVLDLDYRDTETPLVHKDLRLRFDSNAYCVPERLIGKRLTLKADSQSVTIPAVGDGVRPWVPSVSKNHCWKIGRQLAARRHNSSWWLYWARQPRIICMN
jgi:hypothetical protein